MPGTNKVQSREANPPKARKVDERAAPGDVSEFGEPVNARSAPQNTNSFAAEKWSKGHY